MSSCNNIEFNSFCQKLEIYFDVPSYSNEEM